MERKRDQGFCATPKGEGKKGSTNEGTSKKRGEIAYTTDNERELAWRKDEGSDFCLMDRGEEI
jgi:hypothetical protein